MFSTKIIQFEANRMHPANCCWNPTV